MGRIAIVTLTAVTAITVAAAALSALAWSFGLRISFLTLWQQFARGYSHSCGDGVFFRGAILALGAVATTATASTAVATFATLTARRFGAGGIDGRGCVDGFGSGVGTARIAALTTLGSVATAVVAALFMGCLLYTSDAADE